MNGEIDADELYDMLPLNELQWVGPIGNTRACGKKCCPLVSLLPIVIILAQNLAQTCCPLGSPTV